MAAGRRYLPHQEWAYSCGSRFASHQPLRSLSSISPRSPTPLRLHDEVLQPEGSEVVAAHHQEVVLGVVGDAEQGPRLPHQPRVLLDDLRLQVQCLRRFGRSGAGTRAAGAGVELERLEVPAGDERAVDECRERDGPKGDDALLCLLRFRLQGGGVLPLGRQPQPDLDRLIVGRRPLRVDEAGVPVDDAERRELPTAVDPGPLRPRRLRRSCPA